jgi:serine/threonine-protein kinase
MPHPAADSFERVRAALADRYDVERELGSGGMAVVYLARDRKHDRPVALKILRPEIAAVLGAERFLREIRTAARLQHANIVGLYDSGEADGLLYYVMPFVAGESLRALLTREPQLPLDRALGIARQMAQALGHAHRLGLVHRDIKPENILLSPGAAGEAEQALVADFGIARALSDTEGGTLTGTGLAIGTPGYMSPEQAAAEPTIDARADIYALGCVLYEMLAGHPPFLGRTAQQVLARHSFDAVPPLRTIRPDLPPHIEAAVLKMLAKAPADRFATTTELMERLAAPARVDAGDHPRRRLLVVGAGVVTLAAVLMLALPTRDSTAGSGLPPSVAVLAFSNVGGDTENEPFSDGVADELTTALGKVGGLSVAARTSAFSFKGKGLGAAEVGRRLQVRYVIDGTVRQAEFRRRVSAQLIDVGSGNEMWAESFEYDIRNRDVFAAQDSIVHAIVRELRVKLSTPAGSLATRATENPEAHDAYLKGRFFFARRDRESLRKAREYFEQAIARDSLYARAWAGLSEAYSHSSVFGFARPSEMFPRAKAAVRRALELDSTLVEAHTSMGFIALFHDWDWDLAGREFDRALAIDSTYPPAHLFHAWYYLARSRTDSALGEFRTAVRLDPFSLVNNARLTTGFWLARRYDEAVAQAKRTEELDPQFFQAHTEAGRALVDSGRCTEGLAELEAAAEQHAPLHQGTRGYSLAKCGRRAEALAELRKWDQVERNGEYVSHYGRAAVHAGLGDREAVFRELELAFGERAWGMIVLRLDPAFDAVRDDPRYARIVARLRQ